MGNSRISEDMMYDALKMLTVGKGTSETRLSQFRDAFLAFGSESPDNIQAMRQIALINSDRETGLATRNSQHLFQDIAWEMENLDFPEQLAERLPGVSELEWEAYLRIATMLFALLTNRHSGKDHLPL